MPHPMPPEASPTPLLDRAMANSSTPPPMGLVGGHHPDTAVHAAVAVGSRINRQQRHLVAVLARYDSGLTAQQLAAITGMTDNSVRPRLVELTGAAPATRNQPALVERTDDTRPTASGRRAHVYRLTEAGWVKACEWRDEARRAGEAEAS